MENDFLKNLSQSQVTIMMIMIRMMEVMVGMMMMVMEVMVMEIDILQNQNKSRQSLKCMRDLILIEEKVHDALVGSPPHQIFKNKPKVLWGANI